MKVSMVMAVYNGAWCIERALDSVMDQTQRPDEILICDDGSTDGTPDLIERRYGNAITVLRLPHRNAAATRRVGLDRATGDWIAFMDADDTWLPEKQERELAFIAAHPEVRLVTADGSLVSSDGTLRESWFSDYFDEVKPRVGDLFPALVERCFVLLSSTMVERRAYDEVGGLDPGVRYSYDYDLWLRILARHPGGVLCDRLTTYFTSAGALSRNIEARYRDDLAILRRVEAGKLGRPEMRLRAAERAAATEYDLGLICLRTGRAREGRVRLKRAMEHGPIVRRMLATLGMLAPGWALDVLKRSSWLKGTVHRSREPVERIATESEYRGAA